MDHFVKLLNMLKFKFVLCVLCSPELVPQIEGGEIPAGLVTENVSVKHCVAVATFFIPPAA